ncbi:helix-turn-helix domain-containing protein [Streptomyces sp. NPDC101062]|uniref:helix-turn-helix domain-containing protein n=1 Tax=unclassified Streptomyces TaxID=2593676 RepID=UPI002E76E884|nr:helix-turn-helix transcriptional regulator [Streptomyces sp. JV176]MEE1798119.1 helix-turn-helix transcriptional regulator [Streptomyces sp. JV176]
MTSPDRSLAPPASLLLHGATLTVLREGQAMQPSAAASAIGCSEAVLRRWERGTQIPSPTELDTLIKAYGVVDPDGTKRRLRALRYPEDSHLVYDNEDGWPFRMWRISEQACHRTILATPAYAPRLVLDLTSPNTDDRQVTLLLPDSILHQAAAYPLSAEHLRRLACAPLIDCRLYPTAMAPKQQEEQGLLSKISLSTKRTVWVDQDPAPTYRTGPRSAAPAARLAGVAACAWSLAVSGRRLTEAADRLDNVREAPAATATGLGRAAS